MTHDEMRRAAEYLAGFDVIGKELGYQDDPVPLDLAAKLRAMADAPSGWQPIETAPRDGTCVLQHYLGEVCAGC